MREWIQVLFSGTGVEAIKTIKTIYKKCNTKKKKYLFIIGAVLIATVSLTVLGFKNGDTKIENKDYLAEYIVKDDTSSETLLEEIDKIQDKEIVE